MGSSHIVVDGSNIATEGRSMPSLQQLLDAVAAVKDDQNPKTVTVIVDATFGHRIDKDEREEYDNLVSNGEIITPPAGVIGRGDAFILEVADRADAIVLSNDSFQEFHGTHRWLFDEGRLLGGKHVPGVGWIFLDRNPVRGPASRKAVSEAKRKRSSAKKAVTKGPKQPAAKKQSSKRSASRGSTKAQPAKAAKATGRRAKSGASKEPEPYNEALPFIEFVGANAVGSIVEGEVEVFSSHGAYVLVGDTRCYVPLKALGDPAPRSARDVLTQGEKRSFRVAAIDTPRRGIDLTLAEGPITPPATADDEVEMITEPGAAETPVEAMAERIAETDLDDPDISVSQRRKLRAAYDAQAKADVEAAEAKQQEETEQAPTETAASRRSRTTPTRKAATVKKAAAKKTASKKATAKKSAARKAAPKKASAKKSAARKAAPKKASAKKSAARKAAPKKAAAKKSAARKAAPKKAAAKKNAARKAAPKKAAAKKAAPKKATAKKSAAKKSAAKRAPRRR